mmetsp:Transcript_12723/g.22899  ORF Transcript_12723/g.22899 Transcript_12723/m.22899 type:complete len:889 (-) Transcript_12723:251-2917(-)|eukprot:CAMPEP_0201878886 /NCGR_PEP_ID=MMETSP0902-20130614/9928_1 /ASSEMBLY_ACC=CAM_ASM_000551 /TAXON_ID=420261 /ORGANISM="Thalassiosira antarctica, Strain CCMP982" /LENGTH=888 /DNA_ID=CAMNT_0048406605 /DNA_START=103 /DNA_END=2769 /DNA_ORIENTATION=+
MGKTTKRSRKFIAKGGSPKTQLDKKKGASLTKKGKTKRVTSKDKNADASGKDGLMDLEGGKEDERNATDFLNTDNLGQLDMDSFFEKAVGLAKDDDEDDGSEDGDSGSDDDDDDDDGSVDSYTSLGSEEDDVDATEAQMKATLDKMASKDPEFHKYLKENESELLEYGDDDDDDEEGEEYIQDEDAMESMANELAADEDEDMDTKIPLKKKFEKQQKEAENKFLLTPLRLQQLEQGAFESHSVKGLKRIIAGYRTACHLSDANAQGEGADSDDEEAAPKKKEFQITSPVVFDRLMAICLVQCHDEFHYHLLGKGSGVEKGDDEEESSSEEEGDDEKTSSTLDLNQPLPPKLLAKSPHFAAIRPLLESFLKSTLHILTTAGKEAKLLQFVLSNLAKYVPYLTAFPKISKPFLKTCVQLWSAPLDTSEDYNAVRLQAFLRIRQLAVTQPYPFIEEALKLTYLSYAQRSKFGTASNVTSVLPTLTFMGNCIVELYTLDYASAYQHAFVYIRQLALHLRSAMMKQTEETKSVVVCWQYMHCLKLWVAVLCAACGSSKAIAKEDGDGSAASNAKLGGGANKDDEANLLRSLVYPLTEIILGVCRLVPIARYAPLRLHCVRLLQQLAASTETFIPTTSLLLGVLDLKEVGMKPLGGGKKGGKKNKSANVRGLRLPLILKLPKEGTLRTMEQLDSVLKEVFVLLNREADMYRYSPGFPEFTFAILQRLRKFNKQISNGRWRAYSKGTMELCDKYSAFATNGRSTLVDAPKDVRRLEALKPVNTPSMRERYESAVGKEKRLEAALQPVMGQKAADDAKQRKIDKKNEKKNNKKRKNEDDSESDADMEEEEAKKQEDKPKPKKKKKAKVVNEADLKNVGALKEEDEVQEGIEWSDSE